MTILDSPGLVGEVTRQALGGAVSAQGGLRRCLDRSAQTTNVYLASWEACHQAGLRAMFVLQDSAIRASQAMLEVALWATPLASEHRAAPSRIWPDPTLKLSAGSTRFLPGRPQPCTEDEARQAGEWADSALRFQAPLGRLFETGEETDGEFRPA
jgi:hypothetical protein